MFVSESSESTHRTKVVGAIATAAILIVVGLVVVGDTHAAVVPLDTSEALSSSPIENLDTAWEDLPDESQLETPRGWTVESDEPVGGGEESDSEGEEEQEIAQNVLAEDGEIDSPFVSDVDEKGESFVPELEENVLVTEGKAGEKAVTVAANAVDCLGPKKCSYRRQCTRTCKKQCKPYTVRVCKNKKFCRCFCKYQKSVKKAKRCVIYKRKQCRQARRVRCLRSCKKFCKKVPRCYCCSFEHIGRQCKKLCRNIVQKTKCGKCRCERVRCHKWCTFVCKKFK